MAQRGAIFTPDTAKIILEVVRYLKSNGFIIDRGGRGGQFIAPPTPIFVRNDSGSEVPPFACMQATGTVENGGQNYVTIDQPVDTTGEAGVYLFNGFQAIEASGFGIANDGPVVRMISSTTTCGAKLKPSVGSWSVVAGDGPFTVIGADDILSGVIRGYVNSVDNGNGKLYGFQLTNNGFLTTESATADIYELADDVFGTLIEEDVAIYDPSKWAAGAPIDLRGLCMKQGGSYYAIQAPCAVEEV